LKAETRAELFIFSNGNIDHDFDWGNNHEATITLRHRPPRVARLKHCVRQSCLIGSLNSQKEERQTPPEYLQKQALTARTARASCENLTIACIRAPAKPL
jgi:hypothetical protein